MTNTRIVRITALGAVVALVVGCDLHSTTPVFVIPPSVSAGYSHTCAIDESGVVRCWGSNRYGELGIGSTDTQPHVTPAKVFGLPKIAVIVAGQYRTCGLAITGVAYCWGNNSFGALGTGDTVMRTGPAPVLGGLNFTNISVGWSHTCGRTISGVAYCWGNGVYGQLGNNSNVSSAIPQPLAGSLAFTNISAGETHSCGIADGVAYCWGANAHGALGSGTPMETKTVPTLVTGAHDFGGVRAGYRYTCATEVGASGAIYCWGMNLYGNLGATTPNTCLGFSDDIFPCSVAPITVQGIPPLSTVSVGMHHTCGLTSEGLAHCWGTNLAGELGFGTPGPSPQPAGPVSGTLAYSTLSVGNSHTCGVTVNAAIYCWGSNSKGQIGDGTTVDAPAPTRVIFPPP